MRKRPKIIVLMIASLIGICLSLPVQIAFLFGYGLEDLGAIFQKLTYLNYAVMLSCLLSAWTLFRCLRWSHIALPATLGIVVLNNWQVAAYGELFSFEQTIVAGLAFTGLCLLLYLPSVQRVLGDPKMQHWRARPRISGRVPVCMTFPDGRKVFACTFDLSKSGVFIEFDKDKLTAKDWDDLASVGNAVTLHMNLETPYVVQCQGEIVRRAIKQQGRYPEGLGIRFVQTNRGFRRFLAAKLNPIANKVTVRPLN